MATNSKKVSETLLDSINIEDLQTVQRFLESLVAADEKHFSDDVITASFTFGDLANAIHMTKRTRHVVADAIS